MSTDIQIDKPEAGAVRPVDECNAAKWLWTSKMIRANLTIRFEQHPWQGQRYTSEDGIRESMSQRRMPRQRSTPAHGAAFTTNRNHGAWVMAQEATSVPGDFDWEILLWILENHLGGCPSPDIRVKYVEREHARVGRGHQRKGRGRRPTTSSWKESGAGLVIL